VADHTPVIIKKKKAHGGHGHHGGSWKVAYADFVTAMMAFFMVMWIMGLSDDTRAQIQGYFNDPMGFAKNPPSSKNVISLPGMPSPKAGVTSKPGDDPKESQNQTMYEIESRVEGAVEELSKGGGPGLEELMKHVDVTVAKEGLRIEFVESPNFVFFDLGQTTIRPEGRLLISKIGPILGASDQRIMIEGHTDARPFPSLSYTNWDLSANRALALRQALSQHGVKESQFLAVRGLADTKLRRPDDPYHASNRRVSILIPIRMGEDAEMEDGGPLKIDITK
jgi:chemotaxis protein MotB